MIQNLEYKFLILEEKDLPIYPGLNQIAHYQKNYLGKLLLLHQYQELTIGQFQKKIVKNKIDYYLNNPLILKKLSNNLHRDVKKKFSINIYKKRMNVIYKQVLGL